MSSSNSVGGAVTACMQATESCNLAPFASIFRSNRQDFMCQYLIIAAYVVAIPQCPILYELLQLLLGSEVA